MQFTLKPRAGKPLNFTRRGIYVYLDGQQICHGGRFSGYTVSYDGKDEDHFKRICRRWYRNWKRGESGA